ncbi:hypothetical protein [Flavobacterium granuli]|uniref:DUF4488 domain-containing protein n=1 Tax=Flavobacterium granuli TaxID=280093 RepID=A0A1M5NKF2_9FLAO|nr:hypothetical protein [Flavobacterium granuli]PRZ23312.1 hypothetical protein BC624_10534 [Flavobacterium granuli]SHG89927.1 hypothetical protein SAMN05443373_10534 [Flavobacterium granuli]
MRRYIIVYLILFIPGNAFAQIDKIVGNWVETKCVRTDTLDSGRDELNKDWKAYTKGYKTLDPKKYTHSYYIIPEEEDKLKLTITKEEDFFWATDGKKLKEKIIYKPDFKEYLITIKQYVGSYSYIVKYDAETDKLLFLNYRYEEISSEFERKK